MGTKRHPHPAEESVLRYDPQRALGPLAAPHIMEPRFEVHSAETARPNATIQHLPLVWIRVGQLRTVCIYVNSIEAHSETLPALDPSDQYQT